MFRCTHLYQNARLYQDILNTRSTGTMYQRLYQKNAMYQNEVCDATCNVHAMYSKIGIRPIDSDLPMYADVRAARKDKKMYKKINTKIDKIRCTAKAAMQQK